MNTKTRLSLFLLALCALLCLPVLAGADVAVDATNFPDANFRAYVQSTYGSVLTDSQIASIKEMTVRYRGIADLTGIEYFTSLERLDCFGIGLTTLPALPASLSYLNCNDNQLTALPALPASLSYLNCNINQLTSLPALPASLSELYCNTNQLSSLPALPDSLSELYCRNNQLSSLPALPDSLSELHCNDNQLSSLPALPDSLSHLRCYNNQLTALPALPVSLSELHCYNNQLTSLPALPGSLSDLRCYNNQLAALPALPNSLSYLNCNSNPFTSLPALPASLSELYCASNQLTSLPALPASLSKLGCGNNQLTSLPALPASLTVIACQYNSITALPDLPTGLTTLFGRGNQLTAVDLSGITSASLGFDCTNQTPTLALYGNPTDGYELPITLRNPTTLTSGLRYSDGKLYSDSSSITTTPFAVETGMARKSVKGTLTLDYVPAFFITATATAGGSIDRLGRVVVLAGKNQPYIITADSGYRILDVLVDGVSVGAVNSYTFTNVTTSHTITAQFERIPAHTITATATEGGSISPSDAVSVLEGSDKTFTITARNGYRILDVLVDGRSVGAVNSYTFINVAANHTIKAQFAARPNAAPVPKTGDDFPLVELSALLGVLALGAILLLKKTRKKN